MGVGVEEGFFGIHGGGGVVHVLVAMFDALRWGGGKSTVFN